MTDKLLPCPFCGGEAKVWWYEDFGGYLAQCRECGARLRSQCDIKVIAAWNTRTESAELQKLRAVAEAARAVQWAERTDDMAHYGLAVRAAYVALDTALAALDANPDEVTK